MLVLFGWEKKKKKKKTCLNGVCSNDSVALYADWAQHGKSLPLWCNQEDLAAVAEVQSGFYNSCGTLRRKSWIQEREARGKHYDGSQETLSRAPAPKKLFILPTVNHRLTSSWCFSADLWLSEKKKKNLECFLSISVHQQPFFSVLCCETRGADFPTKNPIDATQWEILPAVSAMTSFLWCISVSKCFPLWYTVLNMHPFVRVLVIFNWLSTVDGKYALNTFCLQRTGGDISSQSTQGKDLILNYSCFKSALW